MKLSINSYVLSALHFSAVATVDSFFSFITVCSVILSNLLFCFRKYPSSSRYFLVYSLPQADMAGQSLLFLSKHRHCTNTLPDLAFPRSACSSSNRLLGRWPKGLLPLCIFAGRIINRLVKFSLGVKSAFTWHLLIGNLTNEKSGQPNSNFKSLWALNEAKNWILKWNLGREVKLSLFACQLVPGVPCLLPAE